MQTLGSIAIFLLLLLVFVFIITKGGESIENYYGRRGYGRGYGRRPWRRYAYGMRRPWRRYGGWYPWSWHGSPYYGYASEW